MKPNMRRQKQRPLSRKAKIVGAVAGAVLVWQIAIISLAAGHNDSDNDPVAADFAGASQAAAIIAAEQHLASNDFQGAKVLATNALSISVISAASLRDLGLAEQGLGHLQQAGALFSQNAALGWRDGPTQLWLAQAFLQQKDYVSAAQRIDAALRIAPTSTDLFDILDQQITDPGLSHAMIERLQLNPDWRANYFRYLGNPSQSILIARSRMLIALSFSNAPPTRAEISPLLSALLHTGLAKLALLVWERFQHVRIDGLYDTGFHQTGVSGMAPFEWSIITVPGANVSVTPNDSGNVLNVTTDGAASGVVLRQTTVMTPGNHQLTFDGNIPVLAHNAFGWRVRCINGGRDLVNSTRIEGGPPYHFYVPQTCKAQYVELLVASSAAAAGQQASFKRVTVT